MNEQEIQQSIGMQTLGRYRVVKRLGRGGMGDVWLCEDPRLKRMVAVKTLPPHNQHDQEFVRRFEREAAAAASLMHPHILQVHDYGKHHQSDGSVITYIVMPYIAGGSLAERLSSHLAPQEALTLLAQAAQAIDYAHQKQIIHRDIKPANMLLRDTNWLVLADFGIARILTGSEKLTKTGYGIGTPEYMAPEQAQGQATLTSDNYSLAVIAYQLFTGLLPFGGETALAIMMQHLTQPPPAPRQFNPMLPVAFENMLMQGLAKDPQQRPALASEFVIQLEQAFHNPVHQVTVMQTLKDLQPSTVSATVQAATLILESDVPEMEQRKSKVSRRHLLLGSGVAAIALTGVGLGIWGFRGAGSMALNLPAATPVVSARPKLTGNNQPSLVLTGQSTMARWMTWSRTGSFLISAATDGQLFRWDIAHLMQHPSETQLYTGAPVNGDGLLVFSLSPDNRQLAIANYRSVQSSTQLAFATPDLKISQHITLTTTTEVRIMGLGWLSNDHLAYVKGEKAAKQGDHDTYQFYVVDSKQPQRQRQAKAGLYNFPFYMDNVLFPCPIPGSALMALVHSKQIEVGEMSVNNPVAWRTRATITLIQVAPNNTGSPDFRGVDWSADGRSIVALYTSVDTNTNKYDPHLVYVNWQERNPRVRSLQLPDINYPDDQFLSLACNPASTTPGVAVGTKSGEIYLWNLQENSQPVRKLENGSVQSGQFALDWVPHLAWSPDGHWLATNYDDASASIPIWKL